MFALIILKLALLRGKARFFNKKFTFTLSILKFQIFFQNF
jgi:hypothetical protein